MNLVGYDYFTGWPKDDIIFRLSCSIGQYGRYYERIKIGITEDLERRFNQHKSQAGWERMIVKYKTSSVKHTNEIEKYFIERKEWMENIYKG